MMMMYDDDCFLRRYNMYGAPVFKQESALGNMKKGANAVAKRAKQGIIVVDDDDHDEDDDDDGGVVVMMMMMMMASTRLYPSSVC